MRRHKKLNLVMRHSAAALLAASLLVSTSRAAAPAPAEDVPKIVEITPELQAAADRGLEYLAGQQQPDGSFGIDRYGKHVGITSLAAIAFMGHGDLPGRGKYSAQVERALDFVLSHQQASGLIAADSSHGPMYGHGFATLFLAEVYGQNNDDRCREALFKAVRLIIGCQSSEGGWRYQPVPVEADLSVTICQVMALRAARNAGIKVPKETIDKAVEYVRKCQNPDGGFRYMMNSGNSAFPRSAAGVATLYYAGIYQDNAIDKGLAYLMSQGPSGAQNMQNTPHYFYGHYYAVQTMFMAGGRYWNSWFPAIRAELIAKQEADGGWEGQAGKSYGTAMALIILQMPNRFLPIFQK
jgi:prenyltransferase beta subunit